MEKHTGSFEELVAFVSDKGIIGSWEDLHNGHKLKTNHGAILIWYPNTGTIQYQGPQAAKDKLREVLGEGNTLSIKQPIGTNKQNLRTENTSNNKLHSENDSNTSEVFVVHGHDLGAKDQLELVLHRLGLTPKVLINETGGGLTIIENLIKGIGKSGVCNFGIVLLTPDDMGYALSAGGSNAKARARQNVVLEMGMLLGTVGLENTVIIKKGDLELPSDASGIIYLSFNYHVKEVASKLAGRLNQAGYHITAEAISKASS